MKVLIDMNLSPSWVPALERHGWQATHWSDIGDPGAEDRVLMDWAQTHGHCVLTHDLDFGTMLALSHDEGPSVLQVRTRDILPARLEPLVTAVLTQYERELAAGALIVVDEANSRVRLLPM